MSYWSITVDGAVVARFDHEDDAHEALLTDEYPDDAEVAYINDDQPHTVTVYYVSGSDDPDEILEGLPFDSIESAESYAQDEGGDIYSFTATIDPTTMEKENP